ncbi:YhdP family protein [Chitiniphilus shinanonensis]|uniref:YhdP family protein n=1 Tax=Chitiniphilus shinanonensis TaxID=553088 RepID=UPI0030575CC8
MPRFVPSSWLSLFGSLWRGGGKVLGWHWRWACRLLLAAVLLLAALALGWHAYLAPRLDDYRPTVERMLSDAVGSQVTIRALSGGWRGPRPRMAIDGLTLHAADGRPALRFSRLDADLSWWSLLVGRLQFRRLAIQAPDMQIRHDAQGVWHVAGVRLDPDRHRGDARFFDWLLDQETLEVRGGRLEWLDEFHQVPAQALRDVVITVDRTLTGHEFNLSFLPPAGLADPIRASGSWRGGTLAEWREWRGEARLSLPRLTLDNADAQWPVISRLFQSMRGTVGGETQVSFAGGRITRAEGDVTIKRLRLVREDQTLALPRFEGRFDWRDQDRHRSLRIDASRIDGATGPLCTDCELSFSRRADGSGAIRLTRLQLDALSSYRPWLPPEVRERLRNIEVAGRLREGHFQWSGDRKRYQGEVALENAQLSWGEALPQLSGISLNARFDQDGGRLNASSQGLTVSVPKWMPEPLGFSRFDLGGSWRRDGAAWDAQLDRLTLHNDDLTLSANGRYRRDGPGPGTLNLTADLPRIQAGRVPTYLPLAIGPHTRDWLLMALRGGSAEGGRIEVSGPLAQFPFPEDKGGRFRVFTRVRGGQLAYAPGWPEITGIDGTLEFHGGAMDIRANRARILGAAVGETHVWIPDLLHHQQHLYVDGRTESSTADFLDFLRQSPLHKVSADYIEHLKAQGRGALALKLDIPLHEAHAARVAGEYRFNDNTLDFGSGVPQFSAAGGQITFTEHGLAIQEGRAQVLGGPVRFSGASQNGDFMLQLAGKLRLRDAAARYELLQADRFSGTADYRARLTAGRGSYEFKLDTPLAGGTVELPAPLGKTAGESRPLGVEITGRNGETRLNLSYGRLLQAALLRAPGRPLSGAVALGAQAPRVIPAAGLAFTGGWPRLDLDDWLALADGVGGGEQGDSPLSMQLTFDQISLRRRLLHDVRLQANQGGDGWRGALQAREAEGRFNWRGGKGNPVEVRLTRLALPLQGGDDEPVLAQAPTAPAATASDDPDYPGVKLTVDDLSYRARELGRLRVQATPQGRNWRLDEVVLENAETQLTMSGLWRRLPERSRTSGKFTVKTSDLGKLLGRMGYAGTMSRAAGAFSGEVSWDGAPFPPDFDSMQGSLSLELGAGQFQRIDPGAARLLSVLSLQSLTRRVKLDFSDVFSEGFEFDSIKGDALIERGIARTDNLVIAGPSAQVLFRGEANFVEGTQNLHVRIVPLVGDTVAIAAGIVNPLAGVAAFLLQRALKDPLGQLVAYEYDITGSMRDPVIRRVNWQERVPDLLQQPHR